MIRSLAMIAVAGAVVCMICLASAFSLGFQASNGWPFPGQWTFNGDSSDWDRDIGHIDWNSPEITKDMNWSGDPQIVIEVPAEVTITQSDTPKMVITGPSDAVNKIQVDGGRIGFGDHHHITIDNRRFDNVRRLKIEIAAHDLESVRAQIASKVHLTSVKTDELKLHVNTASDVDGSIDVNRLDVDVNTGGDVTLSGRADDLQVRVNTGADAKLSGLAVKTAQVHANTGAGVAVAPTDSLESHVNTGASVVVYGHPKQVDNHINTGGNVRYDSSPPPAEPAPEPDKPSVSPSPNPSPPKKT